MDDPYRTSQQVGTCPRCNNTTEGDGEGGRLVCPRGCGEWYPRQDMKPAAWATIISRPIMNVRTDWPWGPALCPTCRAAMTIGMHQEVRFDYCPQHGLWLDAGELQAFGDVLSRS